MKTVKNTKVDTQNMSLKPIDLIECSWRADSIFIDTDFVNASELFWFWRLVPLTVWMDLFMEFTVDALDIVRIFSNHVYVC